MGNIGEILDELENVKSMKSKRDIQIFQTNLKLLINSEISVDYLANLYLLLDDKTQHQELMQSLFGLIETFDYRDQIKTLLDLTPKMYIQSPNWLTICYGIMLNDEMYRSYLAHLFNDLSLNDKQRLNKIIVQIVSSVKNDNLKKQLLVHLKEVVK